MHPREETKDFFCFCFSGDTGDLFFAWLNATCPKGAIVNCLVKLPCLSASVFVCVSCGVFTATPRFCFCVSVPRHCRTAKARVAGGDEAGDEVDDGKMLACCRGMG